MIILNNYNELDNYLQNKTLLVCGNSIKKQDIYNYLKFKSNFVLFSDFTPNPLYESVVKGVKIFNDSKCSSILAIGGGSAIDVAKCIKLYATLDQTKNFLEQTIIPNDILLIAVPTTAGTGSEATKYAVLYYKGEKQSISHDSCIPSVVLFDPSTLKNLPLYHKKASMLDALCHSIESYWSVNSTDESKLYSKEAIKLILENYKEYLEENSSVNELMLRASFLAGKAINITQTTAGHALCYKLTSLYSLAHGHAAALCVKDIWEFMINNINQCVDKRGKEFLINAFNEISELLGCNSIEESVFKFKSILLELDILPPSTVTEEEIVILTNSVNPVRLKNNPVSLSIQDINYIYRKILGVN